MGEYIMFFNIYYLNFTNEDKKKFVLFRINEICDKYITSTGNEIKKRSRNELMRLIDYSRYNNMRDLNKKIKDTFVAYIQGRKI